jgi:hypothetical protein
VFRPGRWVTGFCAGREPHPFFPSPERRGKMKMGIILKFIILMPKKLYILFLSSKIIIQIIDYSSYNNCNFLYLFFFAHDICDSVILFRESTTI